MAQRFEYQLISGTVGRVNEHLASMAAKNWKPVLLSTCFNPAGQVMVVVVVERVNKSS